MKREILTPASPRWEEFVRAYDAIPEDGPACDHSYRNAERIMAEMGDIDIPATLEYFRDHGGYCDCEIGMNVIWNWEIAGCPTDYPPPPVAPTRP
jgi:uncharacterized protein DUF2695